MTTGGAVPTVRPGEAAEGDANADMGGAPTPPAFRIGDERREATANPELCRYCQRHRRKEAGERGGRRPQHCGAVWGRDFKGKDVTCARLDDAHDLWLAVYGGTGPLAHLDVGAQARHLTELRTALDALFVVLDPVRGDLTQLDERLEGEVASALARAEQAAAEADQARRETEAANTARSDAVNAKRQADAAAAEARRNEGTALVEKAEALNSKAQAEEREKDAKKRADGAHESLKIANSTIAEQATQIGDLTGVNRQLTTRIEQLTDETQAMRGQLDQQRTDFDNALADARTEADAKLDQERAKSAQALAAQRAEFDRRLAEQRAQFDRQRQDVDRAANATITELTTKLAQATARAEQATTTADELARLRTTLLTTLLTAGPDDDVAAFRARLSQLLSAEAEDHDDS